MLANKEHALKVSRRIQEAVNTALVRKNISARRASKAVVGNDGLIRDIRAGTIPSADRLEALFDYLGLEYYFGKRPETGPITEIDGERFAAVPRFDAQLAAGDGLLNDDQEPIDYLAFRREWLDRVGIASAQAVLLDVKGNSMEPTLYCGDLVMVDRRKRTIRNNRIYAFRDIDGGARIKRLEVIPGEAIIVRSDADGESVQLRQGEDMNRVSEGIIGEVVWSGHSWK